MYNTSRRFVFTYLMNVKRVCTRWNIIDKYLLEDAGLGSFDPTQHLLVLAASAVIDFYPHPASAQCPTRPTDMLSFFPSPAYRCLKINEQKLLFLGQYKDLAPFLRKHLERILCLVKNFFAETNLPGAYAFSSHHLLVSLINCWFRLLLL